MPRNIVNIKREPESNGATLTLWDDNGTFLELPLSHRNLVTLNKQIADALLETEPTTVARQASASSSQPGEGK